MPSTRVDDPHPVGVHPRQVVDGLLRQHGVVGPLLAQPVEDQRVGAPVAGVAEVVGVAEADLCAHRDEQFTGLGGHLGGERRVGEGHSKQYCRIMGW